MEDRVSWRWRKGGQGGWACASTYLAESSAEMSAERNRWLATLRKKKQRGQSIVEAKRARRDQKRV